MRDEMADISELDLPEHMTIPKNQMELALDLIGKLEEI